MAAFAVDSDEAKQWMEGGDSRAELQVVGGALIGGLGGGSVFTAVGGGLGAGLSSKSADQTRAVADAVTDATDSSLVGNISSNILAGLGGALVGGTAGAAAASNVDLYNRKNDLGNDQAKEDLAASQNVIASYLQNNLPSWITGPLDSANKTVDGWAAQFKAKMDGDAQAIISQPPTTQMARGAANGLSAGVVEGGEPPTPGLGGARVSSAGEAANAVSGTPGYVPDNAILNSGTGDGQSSANNGNINDLESATDSGVPGRVQSRINVTNDGLDHIGDRHLDSTVNASQFTISESDLTNLLQSPNIVSTPVTRTIQSGGNINYVREVNAGQVGRYR